MQILNSSQIKAQQLCLISFFLEMRGNNGKMLLEFGLELNLYISFLRRRLYFTRKIYPYKVWPRENKCKELLRGKTWVL